jgi:acyl-CoA synthetase (AMP-forming)/AMP-acid ligase II
VIQEFADSNPNGLAVDDLTRTRSWAELLDRSQRVAHLLRDEVGLRPDDHVAVLMGNRVEYIELLLGAILAGVWITPINWHLGRDEMAYVLADSGARLIFTDAENEAVARATVAERGVEVLVAGAELDGALEGASDAPMNPDAPAGANMIYTSGTTGLPKGVKRARPESLSAASDNHRARGMDLGLDGRGPHLVTGPLYHAAPLMFAIYDNANGAPLVLMPHWEDRLALDLLEEREIAHTHLVPTMFVRLLRLPETRRARFHAPRLDLVLHGAAPISVAVKRRMIDWWGEILVEYWGATEGGVNTLIGSADWLAHPGAVGRALPAFEIFAVGDDGQRLPVDSVGDLYCRHKTVDRVFEYHDDATKTEAVYLEPGVFTIGDIGRVDAEGYVYLADRNSNTIISGGVNIYPAEVEQVLQEHPAVADVGVFGIPDDEWGESVKAAVELLDGQVASPQLEADILDFARERLAGYKLPRSIDFETALPRHTTGKLYIRLLRDRYWKDRGSKI